MSALWPPAETARRVYALVARATIKKINDKPKVQEIDVELLNEEVKTKVEVFGHYGFKSVPKKPSGKEEKATAVVVFPQGNRSHGITIAIDDRRYRPKDWKEGESGLYDDQKQLVRVRREGIHVFGGEPNLPIEQQVKDVTSIVKKDQVITTVEVKDSQGNSEKSTFDMLKNKMTSTVDKSVLTLEKTKTTVKVDNSKITIQNAQIDIESTITNVKGNQTVENNLTVGNALSAVSGAFSFLGGNSPLQISDAVLVGGAIVHDGLTIDCLVEAQAGIDVTGTASFHEDIYCEGGAVLLAGLTVAGGLGMTGGLGVSDGAIIEDGCTITGGLTASGGVTLNGGTTLNDEIIFDVAAKFKGYTVSALNSAFPPATNAGRRAYVTDASNTGFRATVSGGGSNVLPVFCNGADWIIC